MMQRARSGGDLGIQHVLKFVSELGGECERIDPDGPVDFSLGDVHGLARFQAVGAGVLRATFFIAIDPDASEAREWLQSTDAPEIGELDLAEVEDGTVLRLVVEASIEESTGVVRSLRRVVPLIREAWEQRGESSNISVYGGLAVYDAMRNTLSLYPSGGDPELLTLSHEEWSTPTRLVYNHPFLNLSQIGAVVFTDARAVLSAEDISQEGFLASIGATRVRDDINARLFHHSEGPEIVALPFRPDWIGPFRMQIREARARERS